MARNKLFHILIFRKNKLVGVASSLRELAQLLGTQYQNIYAVVHNERATLKGFTFRRSNELITLDDIGIMKLDNFNHLNK